MAALISTLQLLFLGALIAPVYLQDPCQLIQNTTNPGSYNLSVNPAVYMANTNYSVTISGVVDGSLVILQALNSQNSFVGQWEDPVASCSNSLSVGQQNITNKATATVQWRSPTSGSAPVEIRVLVTFSNNSTLPQLQKTTLNTASTASSGSTTKTPTTPASTTSSVSTVQASSFLLAAVHLLSLFVTGKLFS
nr:placenta-expressed transcript 1 protein-like [Chrysemys picta bellii]